LGLLKQEERQERLALIRVEQKKVSFTAHPTKSENILQ